MTRTFRVSLVALALGAAAAANAASIGINFRRGSGEQDMAATESAGVVPQMNWNNSDGVAAGTSGANVSGPSANMIVDCTGAVVPGVAIAWTANGTWSAPNAGPGDLNLMAGYLDDTSGAGETVITVTGVPYANYDVYAYLGSDGNNRSGRTQLFNFFANDRWIRTNTAPFAGFVEGTATTQPASNTGLANYTHYRSLNTSSFDLRVFRGSNNVGLHGLQIVETDGSAVADWLPQPTAAPAAPATLLSAVNSIGLNFVGGRADANEPDGHVEDDGIVTGAAGVSTVAQANWNNLTGFTGSAAAGSLLDRDGAPLANTTVSWSAQNLYTVGTADAADSNAGLMKGYLDTNDTSVTTVAIADLPATWLEYDVYVYLDGDSSAGRAGNYTISSVADGMKTATVSDTANWDLAAAGGAFTRANENAEALSTSPGFTSGNYVVFSGRHDLSFTLTAQGSFAGASPPRAPISAIQLVATQVIPEPSAAALLALAALGLSAGVRRRTK